ncbi:hypothetical protein DFH06DRAFT_1245430 [Mycena polygramma]|nr:hypothetical protein DFH06DRAFT_1245430 [Mycena polygramma]
MPSRLGELCENCPLPKKELRRCARCGRTRYCSRQCQKAHWKRHKPGCAANVHTADIATSLGPDYSIRLPALQKWSADFGVHIGAAGASALDMLHHRERMVDTMLILYLEFLGTTARAPYTHDLVNAEVISVDDLLRDHEITPQIREPLLTVHTPLPGRLRVLLLDVQFPWAFPMNFLPPPETDLLSVGPQQVPSRFGLSSCNEQSLVPASRYGRAKRYG